MSKEFLKDLIHTSDQYAREKEFWLQKLTGELTRSSFPYDRLPVTAHSEFGEVELVFPASISAPLWKLSNGSDQRLQMVLTAGLFALLHIYARQEDLIVGTPIYRQEQDAEFINTLLPLRCMVTQQLSMKELIIRVRESLMEAVAYQNYPIETLIDSLDLATQVVGFPLLDVILLLDNIQDPRYIEHLSPHLLFVMTREGETLRGKITYHSGLYDLLTVRQIGRHYLHLLEGALVDLNRPLREVEILLPEERETILCTMNQTETVYPKERTLPELFEEQVKRDPDAVAVSFGETVLTYRELNQRANQLARTLRDAGVRSKTIVGMVMERSLEMLIGIWGILKAGGTYLPMDPGFPAERMRYMLEDSETKYLVTHKGLAEGLFFTGTIVDVDDPSMQTQDRSNVEQFNDPQDVAYIIYTSGTTGNPKGILTMHANVSRVVCATNYITITPNDRILQLSNYAFDGSVFDIFGAHLNGARLVLVGGEYVHDPVGLAEIIRKEQISIFFVTTALFNALVDTNLPALRHVRKILFGGERVSVPHARRALEELGPDRLIHVYGPTETTVFATYHGIHDVDSAVNNIPIGKPLANTLMYVLDRDLRPVPFGVTGEVCLAGDGLARGYLKRPELTQEKFVDNPFIPGTKMYRSGDLGRMLRDGSVEFIGRVDHQVKIRGFRIELDEIRARMMTYPTIREAIVVVKGETSENRSICAYITAEGPVVVADLKQYLAKDLPEYMIPLYIIQLETMPLNANGKIDRRALPEPTGEIETGTEYVAPRNVIEEKLVGIWQEILHVERIGIRHDFFELGGHSLKATTLVSRIHKEFQVNVPLRVIFSNPTIEGLAVFIHQADQSPYAAIQPMEVQPHYPVSSAQKRLQILQRILGSEDVSFNMPGMMVIHGPLDRNRFEAAFVKLIQRHETLRTSFAFMDDGEPVQIVHDRVEFRVEYVQVAREELQGIREDFIRPFDLSQAPLLRVCLAQVAEEEHIFLFDMHHIISDGTSMGILVREMVQFYEGRDLSPLRIQYKDYAAWQGMYLQSEAMIKQEAYWLNRFAGELPTLHLPTDYKRPAKQSYAGDKFRFTLDAQLTQQVQELMAKTETTLYMTLLAAYTTLLYKYSGETDIIIGSPIAGRPHSDLEPLIGVFINTLALRNEFDGDQSFLQLLAQVKETALQAFEHQDYQFETLVEKLSLKRDLSRSPIFDTMLILQNMEIPPIHIQNLEFTPFQSESTVSKYDLTLNVEEGDQELQMILEYCTQLFKPSTVERMAGHLIEIIREVVAQPEVKLAEIDILSPADKERIAEFNATERIFPEDQTIHQLFEEQVAQTPDAVAVICKNKQLTYRQLNEQANQLARRLREKGVRSDTVVGIMVRRSPKMLVAMLAVLKAGGAYLPIDPDYPEGRIQYVLQDSDAALLLTETALQAKVRYQGTTVDLDNLESTEEMAENLDIDVTATHLAYVIYTSGSTGQPKGVMIEHRAFHNFICGICDEIPFTPASTILALTTISFDIFGLESLLPLTRGAKVVLADEEEQRDPQKLTAALRKHEVNMLQITPSRMKLLLSGNERLIGLEHLEAIMLGGEAFPQDLLETLQGLTQARIFNMYGPTETTVWSAVHDLTRADKVELGRPIGNTRIYIVNEKHQLQPIGVAGEICIAGVGLARGYLHRPELTAEKFVADPFVPGERMYKTGDLARWLPDGSIDFLGRMDHQVKIRGFRIELGEIESTLLHYPGVTGAVVVAKTHERQGTYLAAYLVSETELIPADLKEFMAKDLPDYEIPSVFISLKEMPLTPNGKIDRKKLPEPDLSHLPSGVEYVAPADAVQEQLVQIWKDVLQRDEIGIQDHFFDIGGNSISVIQVHARIEKAFPGRVTVTDLFSAPTVQKLAELVRREEDRSFQDLKIDLLEWPEHYFVDDEEAEESVEAGFTLRPELYEKLAMIVEQDGVEFDDLFLAMFIYLLADITEVAEMEVPVLVNEANMVDTVKLDFTRIASISALMKAVHEARRSGNPAGRYSVREISQLVVAKGRRAIIPFFYREELFTVPTDLLELYDLIFSVRNVNHQYEFRLEYNGQRLRKDRMLEWINGYGQVMEVLAQDYQLV